MLDNGIYCLSIQNPHLLYEEGRLLLGQLIIIKIVPHPVYLDVLLHRVRIGNLPTRYGFLLVESAPVSVCEWANPRLKLLLLLVLLLVLLLLLHFGKLGKSMGQTLETEVGEPANSEAKGEKKPPTVFRIGNPSR